MPDTVEIRRFVKCYKYKFNFYVWETYTKIDDTDMAELRFTLCPAIARGQGYDNYRCNGLTEHGFECSYACSKYKNPVPFPKK